MKRLVERFRWWWEDNGDAAVAALIFTAGVLAFAVMFMWAIRDVK